MSFKRLRSVLPALLLLLWQPAHPQSDRFLFDLSLINPEAQILNLGDLGLIQSGNVPDFFLVSITNLTSDAISMLMRINYRFNGQIISTGESLPFVLPPQDMPVPPFTNAMLEAGVMLGNGSTIRINHYQTDLSAVGNLEGRVRATGRIPAGSYSVQMVLFELDENGNPVDPNGLQDEVDNHTLTISNPTTLDLLVPGQSVVVPDIDEVFTSFPFFQWYSDGDPGSANFNLTVYEKRPEHLTVQDVLNSPPSLVVEGLSQNFIQYPADNNPPLISGSVVGPVRPLEPGREYYWEVASIIQTTGGPIALESDVFRFRMSNDAYSGEYDPRLIAFLEQILGPQYRSTLDDLLQSGFQPNGQINLEGTEMDINDLMLLVGRIIRGEVSVKGVEYY